MRVTQSDPQIGWIMGVREPTCTEYQPPADRPLTIMPGVPSGKGAGPLKGPPSAPSQSK